MDIEKFIEMNYNIKSYLGNNTIIFIKEMKFYNTYICDNYDNLFYYLIDKLDLLKFTLYKEYKKFHLTSILNKDINEYIEKINKNNINIVLIRHSSPIPQKYSLNLRSYIFS